MRIELPIGTKITLNGKPCEIVESKKCSDCLVQQLTANKGSMQCGKRYNGNTSNFECSKDLRSDKKNIIFMEIKDRNSGDT